MTWLVAFATRSMIFTRVDLTVKLPALTKFFLVKHEKQQGGFMEPIQFYFLETKKNQWALELTSSFPSPKEFIHFHTLFSFQL